MGMPIQVGVNKKQKPGKKLTGKPGAALKFIDDVFIPKNNMDAAMYLIPYGKGARLVGGIVKKGAKHVAKAFRNIGQTHIKNTKDKGK